MVIHRIDAFGLEVFKPYVKFNWGILKQFTYTTEVIGSGSGSGYPGEAVHSSTEFHKKYHVGLKYKTELETTDGNIQFKDAAVHWEKDVSGNGEDAILDMRSGTTKMPWKERDELPFEADKVVPDSKHCVQCYYQLVHVKFKRKLSAWDQYVINRIIYSVPIPGGGAGSAIYAGLVQTGQGVIEGTHEFSSSVIMAFCADKTQQVSWYNAPTTRDNGFFYSGSRVVDNIRIHEWSKKRMGGYINTNIGTTPKDFWGGGVFYIDSAGSNTGQIFEHP